jgi:tetratricopeptide (TPR) repeat protein
VFSAALLAIVAMGGIAAVAVAPSPAYAEAKALSPAVGKPLQEAQSLLKNGDARGALSKIQQAEGVSGHSAYENLVINQMKVVAYSKLGDGANLARAAEAVLATGQVSGKDAQTYRTAAAQGYLAAGNMDKFAEYAKGDPDMQALLAQGYVKQGKYAQAEQTMRDAIAAAGGGAKEDWLLILYDAQRKGGNKAGASQTIETLLRSHPKPEYWQFVLAGLLNQKGMSDKARLDVYRLVYATNSFTDGEEYTAMAETALIANSPGDAKKAMEKGFSSGALGKSATAEREKRLLASATQKAAADQAVLAKVEEQATAQANGDSLEGIGEAYMSYGQFDKAIGLLQTAIAKGVTDLPAAKLHLGIAYAGAKQTDKARSTWAAVPGKDINKQLAGLWALTLR